MPNIVELVKSLPEVIRAASATQLSLAAFLFLLGVGVVGYLMKRSPPGWRFASIVVWLIASLIVFALLVGLPSEQMSYLARVSGQEEMVQGTNFRLDFGGVAAGVRHETSLSIWTNSRPTTFQIASVEPPLEAKWQGGADSVELSRQGIGRLAIAFASPPSAANEMHQIVVGAPGRKNSPGLTLSVFYRALEPKVTVEVTSGAQASGRGQDFSAIYTVCTSPPAEGDYIVESSQEWLTGDRGCGSWSTCTPRRTPDGKSACLDFTLQGHNECLGAFASCDAVRNSEGHVRAIYQLREVQPSLGRSAG